MEVEVSVVNHQKVIVLPAGLCEKMIGVSAAAIESVLEIAVSENSALAELAEIEVSIVDVETSAQVHLEFMDIDGATDVITFHHGEIIICADVCEKQAREHGEPLEREFLRYFIHGLLHLAGHNDQTSKERQQMEQYQEALVGDFWKKW